MKNRFKVHSFNKRILNDHNVPGAILDRGNKVVDQKDPVPAFMKLKLSRDKHFKEDFLVILLCN